MYKLTVFLFLTRGKQDKNPQPRTNPCCGPHKKKSLLLSTSPCTTFSLQPSIIYVQYSSLAFFYRHNSSSFFCSSQIMDISKFLSVLFLLCFLCLECNNVVVKASHKVYPEFQSLSAVEVKQIHRTRFHLQPPKHWMNGNFFSYSRKKP